MHAHKPTQEELMVVLNASVARARAAQVQARRATTGLVTFTLNTDDAALIIEALKEQRRTIIRSRDSYTGHGYHDALDHNMTVLDFIREVAQ